MTGRQRLQKVISGGLPDCVPVSPDFSNMIPVRRTGLPFWDVYLYRKIAPWEAYIDCAKYFGIDSLMDGYFPFIWPSDQVDQRPWERFIIHRDSEKIIVQSSYMDSGRRVWRDRADVFYVSDPPTWSVRLEKLNLPAVPSRFEPVTGVNEYDRGVAGLRTVKARLGDQGLVGVFMTSTSIVGDEAAVYYFADNPDALEGVKTRRIEEVERRFADLVAMKPEDRPDFLCVGGSGSLVLQSPSFFRENAFPAVKRAIELASSIGMPTHVHSCGPEKELVKIMVEETGLSIIDPLEIPPMGDCDLAELKKLYGDRIVLKGNLHTTNVMLRGSPEDVAAASRKAIDDAASGGRFILSTGDQCGRDTPDENLHAMIETARTYGRY